jgi:hypothetical protein
MAHCLGFPVCYGQLGVILFGLGMCYGLVSWVSYCLGCTVSAAVGGQMAKGRKVSMTGPHHNS